MDNQVEEIKRKVDIVDVINRYLPLKKRGRHHIACCPFHHEKTPSFTVSPELQIFKCFGCGKAGDVFTFVQEFEHIDFREALEELAKMAGITLVHDAQLSGQDIRRQKILEINHELAKFYHYLLTSHSLGAPALKYVSNRGITLDTIKLFKIGYSPVNSDQTVTYLTKKGYKVSDLIATGTFGQSQYGHRLYDRFQDRLVFPLVDYRDRILGFSGRIMPISRHQDAAKYINSPETDVYHKSSMVFGLNLSRQSIKKANAVIVTEGEFDMISPYQAGFTNVVAIKGTAFTEGQLQLLRRLTDTIILALDSDFAGNNAARKSIELADTMGFDIKVLDLGDRFKDPDEAIQKDLPFFKTRLQNPIPVWDFIINAAVKSSNPETIKGKKDILAVTLPFIVKIANAVIRQDYIKKLADLLGSSPDSIAEEAQKLTAPRPINTSSPISTPTTSLSKIDQLEQYLLSLIFGAKKPTVLITQILEKVDSFSTPRFQTIAKLLANQSEFKAEDFCTLLPPELQPLFQTIYLSISESLESESRAREIQKVVIQIKTIKLKEKIATSSRLISQLENTDSSDLSATEAEYTRLLSELSQLQKKTSVPAY